MKLTSLRQELSQCHRDVERVAHELEMLKIAHFPHTLPELAERINQCEAGRNKAKVSMHIVLVELIASSSLTASRTEGVYSK